MSAPFVELDWLQARLREPNLRVVDARSTPHGAPGVVAQSGAERYAAGHIPGAIHLDYADDLADPATPYAARVAPPERFATVLGAHGIGDGALIVAYDDGDVPYAARMVWMLRYYGHDQAYILAGGLGAWAAAGLAQSVEPARFAPSTFTTRVHPHERASRDEVLAAALGGSQAQVLDVQRDGTYALRDRAIAGAARLSANLLLEDARGGRLAPRERIAELARAQGLDPAKRTIVYCGSGVAAAGAAFALRDAGFDDVAVYDGSWMEWSHDGLPTTAKGSPSEGPRAQT
ncbi:MAG: sulfurtransferase [Vulcanimicrobiaceae bacterium]